MTLYAPGYCALRNAGVGQAPGVRLVGPAGDGVIGVDVGLRGIGMSNKLWFCLVPFGNFYTINVDKIDCLVKENVKVSLISNLFESKTQNINIM